MKYLHIYDRMHPEYRNATTPDHEFVYYEDLIGATVDPSNTTLVKEDCHSDVFLRLYLNLLNQKRNFCSHVLYMRHRSKLQQFILTDAVMNIEPSLEQFVKIVENATKIHRLVIPEENIYDIIHVNFVTYSGAFSIKNKEALVANALKTHFEYEDSGSYLFTDWQVDCCLYPEARKAKHLIRADYGPDIIVVPNISVGNAIYKCLMKEYDCFGFVVGGDTIGILNSRSDLDKNDESIKILEQIRDKND